MTIDVIIPIYRPDEKLYRLLSRLFEQTMKPRRICLLNTEDAPDFTNQELQKKLEMELGTLPIELTCLVEIRVFKIKKEEFDHGGTRRWGAAQSDADFLLFLTQDAIPEDPFLIEKLTLAFVNEKTAIAYARQTTDNKARRKEKLSQLYNYPKESHIKTHSDLATLGIKTYFCSDVCAMYRNTIYQALGGFVKKTIFNEDMIMAHKCILAGFAVNYVADAVVIHYHRYTLLQQFHRNFDLAVSQAEHPEVFSGVSSEAEGFRYVKKMLSVLAEDKKYLQALEFIAECGFKYLGFFFGKKFRMLPKSVILKFTMSKTYWS